MNLFADKVKNYLRNKLGGISNRRKMNGRFTGASEILEYKYGHFRSEKEQRAISSNGTPIPWFTYPAIDYLDQLNFQEKTMLEWGSGNSSLFFATRVNKLFSVEHNSEWFNHVKNLNIVNQDIVLVDHTNYADAARQFNCLFDIILIDGVERAACGAVALSVLKPSGLIILDNSDRHPDIAATFRSRDFIQIDFHGFGPINPYTWTTSLFLSRSFDIEPLGRQPKIPIGGGY